MKTKELQTSNEVLNTQEKSLSKSIRDSLDGYSKRELDLINNPFSEFGYKLKQILNGEANYSPSETTELLAKLFKANGVMKPSTNIGKVIEEDSNYDRVMEMLESAGITQNNARKGGLDLISSVRNKPMKKSRR